MELVNMKKRNYLDEEFEIKLTGGEILMLLALSANSNSNEVSDEVRRNHGNRIFADTIKNKGLNEKLYTELSDIHNKIKKGEYA